MRSSFLYLVVKDESKVADYVNKIQKIYII